MALYDATERALTFPKASQPDAVADTLTTWLEHLLHAPCPETASLKVWSFDIDLTLELAEDEPRCRGVISVSQLYRLQRHTVVGTCSDREPSEQRLVMNELGFQPDFCIPKNLLRTLAALLPDAMLVHVGDDPQRDRDIAATCNVLHRWLSEALKA